MREFDVQHKLMPSKPCSMMVARTQKVHKAVGWWFYVLIHNHLLCPLQVLLPAPGHQMVSFRSSPSNESNQGGGATLGKGWRAEEVG